MSKTMHGCWQRSLCAAGRSLEWCCISMQSSVHRLQHVSTPWLRTSRRIPSVSHGLRVFASGDSPQTVKMALPHLQFQGPIKDMGRAPPSLAELQQLLAGSMETVQAFKATNPHIINLQKLSNRIKRDQLYVTRQQQQLLEQHGSSEQLEDLEQWGGLTESRLQGIINNLRGFHGELMALHEAPGVVAVCKKFTSEPPKVWAPSCNMSHKPKADGSSSRVSAGGDTADGDSGSSSDSSAYGSSPASGGSAGSLHSSANGSRRSTGQQQQQQQLPPSMRTYRRSNEELQQGPAGAQNGSSESAAAAAAAAGVAAAAVSEPLLVEVDVVAHEGLTWIEVKNQELFGVDSVHWQGSSNAKGLAQQVQALQAVAAAPVNSRRWRCPEVVVYFPSGVSSEVAAALRGMGAVVADGPGSLAALPEPQPPSSITNLDVTSLCALVSEVSWGDPHSPQLQAWAARTVHWRDCLAAQIQQPLLPQLHACLGDSQQLVTNCLAVHQFQGLMDMFSGPREQQRWQELLQGVAVYHCALGDGQQQDGAVAECAFCSAAGSTGNRSQGLAVVAAAGMEAAAGAGADSSDTGSLQERQQQQQQQQQWLVYTEPQRISSIDKLGKQQRAVFGLGDALQATTLTANGNAVRCCEQYGVKLEVVLHRPVWLTGR